MMLSILDNFLNNNDCSLCLLIIGKKSIVITWEMKCVYEKLALNIMDEIDTLNKKSSFDSQLEKNFYKNTEQKEKFLKDKNEPFISLKNLSIKSMHKNPKDNNRTAIAQNQFSSDNINISSNFNLKTLNFPTHAKVKNLDEKILFQIYETSNFFKRSVKNCGVSQMERSPHLIFVLISLKPRQILKKELDLTMSFMEILYERITQLDGMILTQHPTFTYLLFPDLEKSWDLANSIFKTFNKMNFKSQIQIILHKDYESTSKIESKLPNRAKNIMAIASKNLGNGVFLCNKCNVQHEKRIAKCIDNVVFYDVTYKIM